MNLADYGVGTVTQVGHVFQYTPVLRWVPPGTPSKLTRSWDCGVGLRVVFMRGYWLRGSRERLM